MGIDDRLVSKIREIARDELVHFLEMRGIDFDPTPITDGFDPSETGWNASKVQCIENTVCLIRASVTAYQNRQLIEREAARCRDVLAVAYFEDIGTHTQGYVLTLEKATIIAFRGTEYRDVASQLRDIYRDALFTKVPFDKSHPECGRVHYGFFSGVESVWQDVMKALAQTPKENTLWFAGHSLGGALATIAAARIALQSEFKIGGLVTIGQPRVGDKRFRNWLRTVELTGARDGGSVVRIAKARDPVTMVPPELMRFKHNDGFVYITADGRLNPDEEATRPLLVSCLVFVNALKALIQSFTGIQFSYGSLMGDHNSNRYLSHMRSHLRSLVQSADGPRTDTDAP